LAISKPSRFSPSGTVANQIRHGSLGVMAGGTQGRLNTIHMGLSGTRAGGVNVRGSMPRPRPVKGQPGFDAAGRRPMPARPRPGARPVTPAVPAVPPAPTNLEPPRNPLDYRSQSGYIRDMAMLNEGLGRDRRGIEAQMAQARIDYEREMGDAKRGYSDDVNRGNASAAARGILSSGMREDNDADRFREFDRHMAGVEQQYGAGATARLNAALAELERLEALEREGIEGGYRDAWGELYPAAPIVEPEVGGPVGPVAKPSPVGSKPGVPARNPAPAHRPIPGGGVGPAPAVGTPAPRPVPRMSMQQAISSFKGPRTFADGNRRTAAWTAYLQKNGLL
jgi:hypothetical protein